MKKDALKSRFAGGAVAVALASTMAFAGMGAAFADTVGATNETAFDSSNQAKTEVGVIADPSAQLDVTVPANVVVAVQADGTLLAPESTAFKIDNGSVFGVHVSQVGVEAAEGFTLLETSAVASASTANNVGMTMTPDGGSAAELAGFATAAAPTAGDWDVAQGGELGITLAGSMSKIDKSLSDTATKMLTVTWTVAPGAGA